MSECHKTAYEAHGYDVISMSKKDHGYSETGKTERDFSREIFRIFIKIFTITAEILARSLANFRCQ